MHEMDERSLQTREFTFGALNTADGLGKCDIVRRENPIDTLVVGYYERGKLIYAARVRAGLITASRRELYALLTPHIVKTYPFANLPEDKSGRGGQGLTAAKMKVCIWVKPRLVANFEFLEWTRLESRSARRVVAPQ